MTTYFDNLGLDWFDEGNEDLFNYIVSEGNCIKGYYGDKYVNQHFGAAQVIMRAQVNEDKKYEFAGYDTHISGNAIWDVRCNGIDLTPSYADRMEKRCLFSKAEDGTGSVVINVVNADVIPSYLEDDIIKMQVAAFAHDVDYYTEEDDYLENIPHDDLGKQHGIAEGSIFPVGFLSNHIVKGDAELNMSEEDEYIDNIALVRAKVKGLYWGKVRVLDEEYNGFLICRVDTEFGELDIIHSADQIKEGQEDNLAVGSTVFASIVLSGDVAIYEYDKGIILNAENNMRLLRDVFENDNSDRLAAALADNVEYVSDYSRETFYGKENTLARFKYVDEVGEHKIFTKFATIVENEECPDELPEMPGTRCIIMASDRPDNFDTICFVHCDAEGKIAKIHTCADSRYKFNIDKPLFIEDVIEELRMPESYSEAMISRAKFLTFLEPSEEINLDIANPSYVKNYRSNAERMLDHWPEAVEKNDEATFEKLFGYLFAKAIEGEFSKKLKDKNFETGLIANYYPEDAWRDELDTQFEGEEHKKLCLAMKYGKQFFRDFANYVDVETCSDDELEKALIIVQMIGASCTDYYMND